MLKRLYQDTIEPQENDIPPLPSRAPLTPPSPDLNIHPPQPSDPSTTPIARIPWIADRLESETSALEELKRYAQARIAINDESTKQAEHDVRELEDLLRHVSHKAPGSSPPADSARGFLLRELITLKREIRNIKVGFWRDIFQLSKEIRAIRRERDALAHMFSLLDSK